MKMKKQKLPLAEKMFLRRQMLQRLSAKKLRQLAEQLNIFVTKRADRVKLIEQIMHWTFENHYPGRKKLLKSNKNLKKNKTTDFAYEEKIIRDLMVGETNQ